MKILTIFLFSFLQIFAANLLTYNIYERSDRVDIMLSFDAPYDGNIFQKREKDRTSLVLNSLNFEQNINKRLKSAILQELDIEPKQSSLILNLRSSEPIIVNASKTTDGFGLRIRVSLKNTPEQMATMPQANVRVEQATTSRTQESLVDNRYFLVLGVLVFLLLGLFVLKKFILGGSKKNSQNSMSWLVKNQDANISVIYEKYLDGQNKVVLFSHENRKYLVLVGTSNVLLDSFGEEKIKNEEDFAVFFEENKKRLGSFLQDRQNSNLNNYKEKLDNY